MHICSFPHLYLNMYISLIPWEGEGEGVRVCVRACVGGGGGGGGGCGGVGVGVGVWGVFLKTFGRGAWTAS